MWSEKGVYQKDYSNLFYHKILLREKTSLAFLMPVNKTGNVRC